MAMTDADFCQAIHLNIHAIRLVPNYSKPTPFEQKISTLVLEKFQNSCPECKKVYEFNKANPKKEKQSVMKRIGDVLDAA